MGKKIAFAGTDGRSLMSALVVSTAVSEKYGKNFQSAVVRGAPAMPEFAKIMDWPVEFIPTESNSVEHYAAAIISALKDGKIDYVIIMPEDLLFNGLVDKVEKAGFGEHIAGLRQDDSFIEADKIACKKLCRDCGIPVAPEWFEADAKDYKSVLSVCLNLMDKYGGAVLKYPYSAAGKGARIIANTWEIKEVYDALLNDYSRNYKEICGAGKQWPLLIESRIAGVEISFTALIDKNGHFQILPTAMDYPERFPGLAGKDNPITGGMGSISPHPMETGELVDMAAEEIIMPFVKVMKERHILRPCILYPGCIISFDGFMKPTKIRVCEWNIRIGEPEGQPIARRLRNFGALIEAMFKGNIDEITPEVRDNQISMCIALVVGPGGPECQKGYPWSSTKGEQLLIDFDYFKKKNIMLIPSAMDYSRNKAIFVSDGSRVAFLNANAEIKNNQNKSETAEKLRQKLTDAHKQGRIRAIPRENKERDRLDLREDVGKHYIIAEKIFFPDK